jgi:hypothetical protein
MGKEGILGGKFVEMGEEGRILEVLSGFREFYWG